MRSHLGEIERALFVAIDLQENLPIKGEERLLADRVVLSAVLAALSRECCHSCEHMAARRLQNEREPFWDLSILASLLGESFLVRPIPDGIPSHS